MCLCLLRGRGAQARPLIMYTSPCGWIVCGTFEQINGKINLTERLEAPVRSADFKDNEGGGTLGIFYRILQDNQQEAREKVANLCEF